MQAIEQIPRIPASGVPFVPDDDLSESCSTSQGEQYGLSRGAQNHDWLGGGMAAPSMIRLPLEQTIHTSFGRFQLPCTMLILLFSADTSSFFLLPSCYLMLFHRPPDYPRLLSFRHITYSVSWAHYTVVYTLTLLSSILVLPVDIFRPDTTGDTSRLLGMGVHPQP